MRNDDPTHTNDQGTVSILDDVENIEATLSAMQEQVTRLQQELTKVRAKGTGDLTAQAAAAVAQVAREMPAPKPGITVRIESVLRDKIMTLNALAKEIGESSSKTNTALRSMRKNLANVGTPTCARWTWRVGPQATAAELISAVRRLIMDQPLTTAELVASTGCSVQRVSGAMVALQRSAKVLNLGSTSRGRWFLVPESARDARLPPKTTEPKNGRGQNKDDDSR